MKKNTFSLICYKNLLILLFLIFAFKGFGQVNSVTTISPYYCRSALNQNTAFAINFTFIVGTTNFLLDVSDANGNSFTPTGLTATTSGLGGSFSFIMPTNFRGTGYIFRVKSSNPVYLKDSNPIELNFRGYTTALTYNNNVTTINFCGGGSFLRVDEGVIGIPNLIYKWYKIGPPDTLIVGETGSTLFIDGITRTAGTYRAVIDYGICNPTSTSDIVVTFPSGSFATIFSTLGTTITNGQTTNLNVTPISPLPGETYQWYKDDILITLLGNGPTYIANSAGTYKCLVINSSCQGFTNSITLNFVKDIPTNTGPIPNVVSPNNDGVNDYWDLEQSDYGPNTNTDITIVSAQGETVIKTNAYTNNWPSQTLNFGAINPVFYYIISKQGQDARKGSITLIK